MMGWLAAQALAHPLAPAALEVEVVDARTLDVTWRTPTARPTGVRLTPRLDADCAASLRAPRVDDGWLSSQRRYRCPDGHTGARVGVDGLDGAPVDVVLTVREPAGATTRRLLTGDRPVVPLIEPGPQWTAFFGLGVRHLLEGLDHVLLVVGLTLLLGFGRRLVSALAAFTVGHTLTLAVVALGGGGSAPLVEVGIASSLVWLALELAAADTSSGSEAPPGLLRRHPAALCLGIGLLHGAGFGGALVDLGLPRSDVVGALLLFNIGVDVGQLGVVAALAGIHRLLPRGASRGRWVVAYAIGAVATAWTIERIVAMSS